MHFAFGFTGNGVGPTHLAARALASLALDRRDAYTRLPIVGADPGAWVPPEPLAWLGGSLVRRAFLRREEALERGERPDSRRARCARCRRRSGCTWRAEHTRLAPRWEAWPTVERRGDAW